MLKGLNKLLAALILVSGFIILIYFLQQSEEQKTIESIRPMMIEDSLRVEGDFDTPVEEVPEVVLEPVEDTIVTENYGEADATFDAERMQEINKDIYAWISIPGTVIDYPILQSGEDRDEDFYLDHNLDLSKGYPGCLYTQSVNGRDFMDPVTIIYGHNMRNNTYFGSLRDLYTQPKSFEEMGEIFIYTPGFKKTYRIIASCTYDDRLIPVYYSGFGTETNVCDFIRDTLKMAELNGIVEPGTDPEMVIDSGANVLVLSTCVGDDEKRYLVMAVRTDQ